jgi:hypothetical protein
MAWHATSFFSDSGTDLCINGIVSIIVFVAFILLVAVIFLYINANADVMSNPHFSEKGKQHALLERCN